METCFSDNFKIIQQRWPYIAKQLNKASLDTLHVVAEQNTLIVNDIQLTSNYDRTAEAKLQCDKIDALAQKVYVYGVGLGDVPLYLLEHKRVQSVVVCILNMDLFLHSLNALEHDTWLSDPRITLTVPNQLKDVFFPFVALPAELHFADDESATLRDRVIVELNHEHAMLHHSVDDKEIQKEILSNIEFIEKDGDVSELFNTLHQSNVFIAAAGPTLSYHIEYLKQLKNTGKNFVVIAVDAALKPLLSYGLIPDLIVSIDVRADKLLEHVDFSLLSSTKLIYFPRISARLIKAWKGPRYCSYSYGEIYQSIYVKYPRGRLYASGSVIHTTTDLAVKMGATSIIFLGADFGFPEGKTYADGQDYNFTNQYKDSEHWVINGHGDKISTMLNYRAYLRDLERYIEQKPNVKFYNTSLDGARITGTSFFDTQL